jgi:hypothetical protein
MWLPVGADIKFAMIPTFDKSSVPNLAALFGCAFVGGRFVKLWNGFGLAELLLVAIAICPFITAELNSDPIQIGRTVVLPAVSSYDAGSEVITQFIALIPFFLGRQIFRSRADTEEILRVLAIAGLIYSLPAIFEIRFSPRLHPDIYGYVPNAGPWFVEQMRAGGFRPAVFMGHGLLVAFFFCTTAIAASAFWRTNTQVLRTVRFPASGLTVYLVGVLWLCKTVSASLYGVVLVPFVLLTKPKIQISIAVFLVSGALLYPMLRASHLVPTGAVLDLAASTSGTDRAGSLEARLIHESQILGHLDQRFLFGWGRFGRGWVYDNEGKLISDLDGTWIITLGTLGVIGFLALFGLLALPVFNAALALRFAGSTQDKVFLSALSLILAINVFDLLPNSSLSPWTWLVAGALLGRTEALRRSARFPRQFGAMPPVAHVKPVSRSVRYTRSRWLSRRWQI